MDSDPHVYADKSTSREIFQQGEFLNMLVQNGFFSMFVFSLSARSYLTLICKKENTYFRTLSLLFCLWPPEDIAVKSRNPSYQHYMA